MANQRFALRESFFPHPVAAALTFFHQKIGSRPAIKFFILLLSYFRPLGDPDNQIVTSLKMSFYQLTMSFYQLTMSFYQ